MRILLVEDDAEVARFVCKGLREAGHSVEHVTNGRDGLFLAASEPFDVLVLDRMLPGGVDGVRLVETLRAQGNRTPVLFLSALSAVDERVRGLKAGGDDYLPKPFALAELVARLRALGRRGEIKPQVLQISSQVELALEHRQVRRQGELVRLTAKEYLVLELLALNKGRVFTREEILERIWGPGFEADSNLIDVYVKNLRKRLGEDVIETVRGVGYRLGE